jgi:DNA polymerase III subunit delta
LRFRATPAEAAAVKVAPRDFESFARKPAADILAVLLYGPDVGLVRERGDQLVASIAGGLDDPFRVSSVPFASLRDEPSRLRDEAEALSFGGGRRAVRLRDAADGAADAVELLLAAAAGAGMVVLEAGDLGPRSALRRLFEGAKNAAAIPCYRDEGADLQRFVAETLKSAGLQADRDALAYLTGCLGGDRSLTRRELEKLIDYMGPPPEKGVRSVTLTDAEACVGDSSEASLDDLVFAAGDGKLVELETILDRVFGEGASPITMLRAAGRHFQRLQLVAGAGDADAAIARLRPPVFYQRVPRFKAQARRWRPSMLAVALSRLVEAELDCKRTGWPAETIARRTLLEIARLPGA